MPTGQCPVPFVIACRKLLGLKILFQLKSRHPLRRRLHSLLRISQKNPWRKTQNKLCLQILSLNKTQFAQRKALEPSKGTVGALSSVSDSPPLSESSENVNVAHSVGRWQKLQVLGQSGLTYIIAQSDTAVVFIDQHAAHERVAYERIMEFWEKGGVETQQFLLPFTMELEEADVEAVLQESSNLKKLGLEVEQMGPMTLAVQSAPIFVKEKALQKTLEQLAKERLEKGGSFAFEKCLSHIAATMACHSVIRAGKVLSLPEMEELLVQMDKYPLSSFCPHGRPVYVEYPFHRLEKDFGRIV